MKVELQHVGVGCNRVVNAVSWGHSSGLVAYAAHNAVIIYDPQEARVAGTLLGHIGVVNCVSWIPARHFDQAVQDPAAAAAQEVLASGAADNTVRLWLWSPKTTDLWKSLATLEGHTAPVTSITTFRLTPDHLLLASTAGDGNVLIWECTASSPDAAVKESWRLHQRIEVGFQMQDCVAMARLPADPHWLVLALGGVDSHVRLYTCPPGGQFEEVCKLSGHQDWVRGLVFAQMEGEGGRLLLASASQDKYVRIWAIQQQHQQQPSFLADDATETSSSDSVERSTGPRPPGILSTAKPSGGLSSTQQLIARYAPRPHIVTPSHSYSATLEALLIGHEDWVHSVAWHPAVLEEREDGEKRLVQPACLLSASMDRTMMIWKPDKATGLWMSVETVGDAGPNHLGYYTGVFNGDGTGILAHGFTGALHMWRREGGAWIPKHALGGHFAPIVDACWGVDDTCLLTVSIDQTARITSQLHDGHWCEIARPQVHGHDFSTAAFIPTPAGASDRQLYASGSEEKVIRVFEAPQAFRDTLAMARGEAVVSTVDIRAAFGATLPALGLSNKAVYVDAEDKSSSATGGIGSGMSGGDYTDGPDFAPHAAPSAVAGPPLEEHLAQNTLWPEVRKLYGHGNDVYCVAADPLGRYLASACRAQSAAAAGIWLWDATGKWVGLGQLAAHTLTVTQMAFSPNGRFLASGSRDRSCALFERCEEASPPFRLVCKLKAHSRIVWGLGWSPDSQLLATGSRDNTVKLWGVVATLPRQDGQQLSAAGSDTQPTDASGLTLLATLPFVDAVCAVAFAPVPSKEPASEKSTCFYPVAVGLENGSIQIVEVHCSRSPACQVGLSVVAQTTAWQSGRYDQHAAAVRRLCWRRDRASYTAEGDGSIANQQRYNLASVGDDHAVRVYSVQL